MTETSVLLPMKEIAILDPTLELAFAHLEPTSKPTPELTLEQVFLYSYSKKSILELTLGISKFLKSTLRNGASDWCVTL